MRKEFIPAIQYLEGGDYDERLKEGADGAHAHVYSRPMFESLADDDMYFDHYITGICCCLGAQPSYPIASIPWNEGTENFYMQQGRVPSMHAWNNKAWANYANWYMQNEYQNTLL